MQCGNTLWDPLKGWNDSVFMSLLIVGSYKLTMT